MFLFFGEWASLISRRSSGHRFFDSLGIEQQNEVQPKDLYFWFSVGADSAEHGPHFHDDSSAAAVLYLQVPPDAGKRPPDFA